MLSKLVEAQTPMVMGTEETFIESFERGREFGAWEGIMEICKCLAYNIWKSRVKTCVWEF